MEKSPQECEQELKEWESKQVSSPIQSKFSQRRKMKRVFWTVVIFIVLAYIFTLFWQAWQFENYASHSQVINGQRSQIVYPTISIL